MAAAQNFFARLARRALAPPAVRPRLASRFETPAPVAAAWPAAEETIERAVASPVLPVATAAVAVEPIKDSRPPLETRVERSDPPPRIGPISRLTEPPAELPVVPPSVPEIRAPAGAVQTPTQPAPMPESKLAVALEVAPSPAPPRELPAEPVVEAPQATIHLRHETLVQLVPAPATAAPAAPNSLRLAPPQPVAPVPAPLLPVPPMPAASPAPIEITIGRIEIRATEEPERRPPPAAAPSPPMLTLADYLRQRDRRVS